MAEVKRYKVIFQFRRATTEQWSLNEDEIPYAGEPCYDLDLGTLKIGDGRTAYRDLKTISGASVSDDGLSLIVCDLQEDINKIQNLIGNKPVSNQIADAIANIDFDIDEQELQAILNAVLDTGR